MKYIIATVSGARFDLAPEFTGKFGKEYKYGSFKLIIWKGGDYFDRDYDEAYKEIADYVAECNKVFKGNPYYNAWIHAEMLTPNEHGEYNDIHCVEFHSWLVEKMITSDQVIVSKVNVCEKDLHDRIDTWKNMDQVGKIARVISTEMLKSIHLPGEYMHNNYVNNSDLYLKDYPIFEMGWTLTYSIQIIDTGLSTKLWLKERGEI